MSDVPDEAFASAVVARLRRTSVGLTLIGIACVLLALSLGSVLMLTTNFDAWSVQGVARGDLVVVTLWLFAVVSAIALGTAPVLMYRAWSAALPRGEDVATRARGAVRAHRHLWQGMAVLSLLVVLAGLAVVASIDASLEWLVKPGSSVELGPVLDHGDLE